MNQNNLNKKALFRRELLAYFLLTVGSLLFAVGDVMFVNPYLMAPGGTYGLSNVFNTLWPWKISLYAICMDQWGDGDFQGGFQADTHPWQGRPT